MASLNCKKCGTIHPVCDNFVKRLTWIPIDVRLPADEIAVLMHIEECERPFFGYKIGCIVTLRRTNAALSKAFSNIYNDAKARGDVS